MIISILLTIFAIVLGFRFTFFLLRVCGRILAIFLGGFFYLAVGFLAAAVFGLGMIAFILVLVAGIAAICSGLARA